MFLSPIGFRDITQKFTNAFYNLNWKTMVDWWNDHDAGRRPWTSVFAKNFVGNSTVFTTTGNYAAITTDVVIVINKTVGAATTVTLPANPQTGRFAIVKDGKGDANANNITVQGASGNIDGAATYVMNVNYRGLFLVYNGTEWNKVSIF